MIRLIISLFLLFWIFSCKTLPARKPLGEQVPPEEKLSLPPNTTKTPNNEDSVSPGPDQKPILDDLGTFEQEYAVMKAAIAEYKKSTYYKNPKNEEDINFNTMVDFIDKLDKEEVKDQIKEGKFTQYQEKINKHLTEIEAAAKKLINETNSIPTENENTSTETITSTSDAPARSTNTSTNTSELNSISQSTTNSQTIPTTPVPPTKTKTNLQQNSAIVMVVFGTLGMLSALGLGYGAYKIKNFQGRDLAMQSKLAKGLVIPAIPIGLLSTFSLVVGALILADKNPNDTTVKSAQASFGTGAAIIGISAIALGGLTFLPNKYLSQQGDYQRIKLPSMPEQEPFSPKSVKKFKLVTGLASVILVGTSVGLAIWTHQLGLVDNLNPKDKFIAKIGRAFLAFQSLEQK